MDSAWILLDVSFLGGGDLGIGCQDVFFKPLSVGLVGGVIKIVLAMELAFCVILGGEAC